MALSMQYLATNILLDSLQPMVRQSAKTVEANIHMLADRMMTLAGDLGEAGSAQRRAEILAETAEIYELHTIALYDLDGKLIQGIDVHHRVWMRTSWHSFRRPTTSPPHPPRYFRKNWALPWVCP